MIDTSFLDNPTTIWSREMTQFMEFFVKNTTQKIFRRMAVMDVNSPTIKNSIHGIIYNNSNGDMRLVRFYYLNIARFIEMGLGHNFQSDYDLGREGVKVRNADAPAFTSGNVGPLEQKLYGFTDSGRPISDKGKVRDKRTGQIREVNRKQYHLAKPFLMSSIRSEVKRMAERIATQFCYTHTVYLSRGLTATMAMEEADKQWRLNMGLLEEYRAGLGAMHVDALENL